MRPGDDALVGRGPRGGASDVQRIVGEIGERAHQIVAQCRAGLCLPPVIPRQHANRIPQPAEVERVEHLPVRGGSFADRQVLPTGEVDDVERRCASTATATDRWATDSGTPAASRAASLANSWSRTLPRRCESRVLDSSVIPGRNSATTVAISSGGRRWRKQPQRTALDHPASLEEQLQLRVELDVRRQRLDLFPHRREVEDVACRNPGAHHVDDTRAGVFGHAVVERDARQVDHLVGDLRGDDLAPQPVIEDLGAIPLLQHRREVANEIGLEVRIVGKLGAHHLASC